MKSTFDSVRRIFLEAIENHPPENWPNFLDDVCRDDTELRLRVETLLEAHVSDEGVLDCSVVEPPKDAPDSVGEQPKDQIGPYKLLQQLGEGGMGVVYLAEQESPIQRQVALKIVKPGLDSKQVIARFRAEQQTLALLDHPHIAKVLDAGTTESGRPYFVMELVHGVPITEYCDEARLSPRERVALCVSVCDAVQHAHQKGIIHRDLKPSNLIVALQDGEPVPKVIDFGISKATQHRLTPHTLTADFGETLGTIEYMSPEQADPNETDIDTRSDVYSLGVVIYELLTGTTPLTKKQLRSLTFESMLRMIRETDPPKPSTRSYQLNNNRTSADVCQEPNAPHPSKLLRGDLDWIVMKALEKDRSRRYDSASALAADLTRYLDGDVVDACPPSAVYRFRKLARRHRVALSTVSLVMVAILTGAVVAIWQAARAIDAEQQAVLAKETAKHQQRIAERQLYVNTILAADNAVQGGNGALARRLLDQMKEHELRGWEWSRLRWLADRSIDTLFRSEWISAYALSPDGKRLVTAGGKTLTSWDIQDPDDRQMKWETEPDMQAWGFTAVAYSPDSSRVLAVDTEGVVRMHDAVTGSRIGMPFQASQQKDSFYGLAFHPDGSAFATGDSGGNIKLWDAKNPGRMFWKRRAHRGIDTNIQRITFSPDGRQLASCCMDGSLKLWNVNDGNRVASFEDPSLQESVRQVAHDGYATDAAFSPDGKRLVSCGHDKLLKIWDTVSQKLIRTLRGHQASVNAVTFSPDGRHIASVSNDRTLRIWDATTYREVDTLLGSSGALGDVTFGHDGHSLVTWSGKEVIFWTEFPTPSRRFLTGHESWRMRSPNQRSAVSIDVSADGKRIISAHRSGLIKLWDAASGEELHNWISPNASVVAITAAISPDGSLIVSGGSDGTISAWKANDDTPLYEIQAHGSRPIYAVDICPDGTWMASASADNTIKVWEVQTGQPLQVFNGHADEVLCVAISPNGRLISGGTDGTVRIWDRTKESHVESIGHAGPVHTVAINQTGDRIVSGGADKKIILWDATTGTQLKVLEGHTEAVRDVSFSDDGTRIVSTSDDGTLMLWTPKLAGPLLTITPEGNGIPRPLLVACAAFLPGDTAIVAGLGDGEISIWDRHGGENNRDRRHQVAAARELVDQLSRKHGNYNEVIDSLEVYRSESRDPDITDAAVRIAQARRNSFAKSICMDIRTLWHRQPSAETYQVTLGMAEQAAKLAPDSPMTTWMLGAAEYYAGEYQRAKITLQRVDERWQQILDLGHPLAVAYLCMTLHHLGEEEGAIEQWQRLQAIIEADPTWESVYFRSMGISEARLLFEGRSSRAM